MVKVTTEPAARCPVTGNALWSERKKREAPAPGSCCLSGRPGPPPVSSQPLTATRHRYSQPCRHGEVRVQGPSDQSKASPPPGLLEGRAEAEAARASPALPAIPPPPRSPV